MVWWTIANKHIFSYGLWWYEWVDYDCCYAMQRWFMIVTMLCKAGLWLLLCYTKMLQRHVPQVSGMIYYGIFHKLSVCSVWYVPHDMVMAVCSTRGWTARGVVIAMPSLVSSIVSGALCGNALTSLCLSKLMHFDLVISRHGSIWGSSSWRVVGCHFICLLLALCLVAGKWAASHLC